MIDDRFYRSLGPITAETLAMGAELIGVKDRSVTGVASLDAAGPGALAYYDGRGPLPETGAGVIVAPAKLALEPSPDRTIVRAQSPRAHFARAARFIIEEIADDGPLALHPSAVVEQDVALGPGVALGANVRVGAGTRIGANAVIGPGVAIGRNCRIGANVTIACSLIGDGVTILPGAAIGQAGFGVALTGEDPVDVPHFGRVVIQDGASIGANVTIDRGLFADTMVGEHAKIDNLCHVAHNVKIGRGAVMAAFAGISGTVEIGDGAVLAGRVGLADHVTIGRGAVLAAGSLVMHDIPPGQRWAGYPAKPIRQWLRETAWLARTVGKRDGADV